jgi:hypothetical protein
MKMKESIKNKIIEGEEVIALSNSVENEQLRVKGNLYVVNAIGYCSGCGEQIINISGESKIKEGKCTCGNIQPSKGLWWTKSRHFVKSEESSIKKALEEALELEDYELAITLRDL